MGTQLRTWGYYVALSYRTSRAGMPAEPYVEYRRRWFPWKWLASFMASPRLFVCRISSNERAFIQAELLSASTPLGDNNVR